MSAENCSHLLADLSDYIDQQASAEVCQEIERHMASCEDCRVVVDTLRKTITLYQELPGPSLSAAARERLFATLDLADFQ